MKILILSVLLAMAVTAFADKKIFCYYESWATYSNGGGKYSINDIKTNMCTHVLYAFAGVKTDGSIKILDNADDLYKFTNFVKKTPGVKALLSVGGASEGSKKFSTIVTDPDIRRAFVKNSVAFLEKYNFDGLDVDWEYPNRDGGKKSDKQNYVELLKELHQAFSSKKYLLTAAVAAEGQSASISYIISEVAKYLDYINIMTYDFAGSWDGKTGLNAPLYASSKDNADQKTLTVDAAVTYWLSQGAPASKIIVGIPFYGASFTLKNAGQHGLYAPSSGPGKAGPYSGDGGELNYNEICTAVKKGSWTVVRDKERRELYAYNKDQWVSYDDPAIVREKAEYIKSKNLGGAMVWAIDMDDFQGACGAKYPLLSALNEVLRQCKYTYLHETLVSGNWSMTHCHRC